MLQDSHSRKPSRQACMYMIYISVYISKDAYTYMSTHRLHIYTQRHRVAHAQCDTEGRDLSTLTSGRALKMTKAHPVYTHGTHTHTHSLPHQESHNNDTGASTTQSTHTTHTRNTHTRVHTRTQTTHTNHTHKTCDTSREEGCQAMRARGRV